jgi:molecular chaperone DnaJ
MPRDYYEVLGISRDASETDVKKAFRGLARELHPDVNDHDPAAEEKFKEAAEAYEVLSDPERRATYDRYGHEGLRSGGFEPHFQGFGSFADIFDAFFGGGDPFGGRRSGPAQGGDVAVAVEVSLADAARGVSETVEYDVVARCERCHGNGAEPGTPIETCERCGGSGQLQSVRQTAFGQMVRTMACDTCDGDGRVAKEPCTECRGRGRVAKRVKLDVDVPEGIADGQRIRVAGRGHDGERGGPPGDLYVLVSVLEDERFMRDGNDLITVVDIPAPLAALGTRVTVPTLDGDEELEIPAGTQPRDVFELRGHGMPSLRRTLGGTGGRQGDLRVVVNVVIPRHLNDEQRELLERLSESIGPENLTAADEDRGVFAKLRRAFGA